jgi:hypothetical protein
VPIVPAARAERRRVPPLSPSTGRRRVVLVVFLLFSSPPCCPPAAAAAAVTPMEEEGHGHAPREVQPRNVPSQPHGAQVEVDHHGDGEIVFVVVTAAVFAAAVTSIALWMNPSTFLPRADRCATSGGPPSGILQGASSPPPLLPPLPPAANDNAQRSVNATRDLSLVGGVRRHLLLYNSASRPTHQFCSLRD